MNTRICENCGKEFHRKKRVPFDRFEKRRFCSRKCLGQSKVTDKKKICFICNKEFFSRRHEVKLCSRKCIGLWMRTEIPSPKKCLHCKKEFSATTDEYRLHWDRYQYCSRKCSNNSKVGKRWKMTEAQRKNLSNSHKGERSHFWKGGITSENLLIRESIDIKIWRESIFKRDNWTCQKCGMKRNLCAHHIQNFSDFIELRTSISNGITICREDHEEFHKKYGKKNNTKEQLEEFLRT